MLGVREGLRLWILGLDTQGLLDPYESLECEEGEFESYGDLSDS